MFRAKLFTLLFTNYGASSISVPADVVNGSTLLDIVFLHSPYHYKFVSFRNYEMPSTTFHFIDILHEYSFILVYFNINLPNSDQENFYSISKTTLFLPSFCLFSIYANAVQSMPFI